MRSVNFAGMRHLNRSIVLNLIRKHGAISRGEISKRSHLAPSAVSKIIADLKNLDLIKEGDSVASGGGRPMTMIELNPDSVYAIGVNIGFTDIVAVAANLAGRPVLRTSMATNSKDGSESVLARVAKCIRGLLDDPRLAQVRIGGVGVGVPGLVDTKRGVSLLSPNLGWRDVRVRDFLESELDMPVYVDNDVRAATLGEYHHGAGQDASNLVALFVGSAIGAGVILDGRLFYGSTQSAGEIGHVRVSEDGPLCSCGKYGCLEAVASGRAIARRAARLLKMHAVTGALARFAHAPDLITAKDVADAAQNGDETALQIMTEAARYVGLGLSFLVNLYNPELIILSGGVSRSGDILFAPARKMMERHAMPIARDKVKVVAGQLGSDAGPIGAAALVVDTMFPSIELASSGLLTQGRHQSSG